MVIVGVRHSTTRLFQMIGRLLRDVPNKPIVKVVHMLDFAPHLPASPNLESDLNDCLKFLYATFLLLDVIAPSQVQTNDLSAPTGQLTNNVRQSSSNIFDDLEIDLNQRNDLVEKSYKKLASKFLEGHRDGFKELLPEIVQSWLVDNNVDASIEEIEKLADKVWKIIPSSSQTGIDLSDVDVKLLEAVGPLGFLMRFAGFDITKESLKDSLSQFSSSLNQGEAEQISFLHKYFKFFQQNQRFPKRSGDEEEVFMNIKMQNIKSAHKAGGKSINNYNFYQSSLKIAEEYGFPDFFDFSAESASNKKAHETFQFTLENERCPSNKSKDSYEAELGRWLIGKKFAFEGRFQGAFYESDLDIAKSYGLGDIFEKIDKEKIAVAYANSVCRWILVNNKIPSSNSDNVLENKIGHWVIRLRKNIRLNKAYQSVIDVFINHNLKYVLDDKNLENDCLSIALEYIEFYQKNSTLPSTGSKNSDERRLAVWIKRLRKIYNSSGKIYKSTFSILKENNLLYLLECIDLEKQSNEYCVEWCQFFIKNKRRPTQKDLDHKKIYGWFYGQIKAKKGSSNQVFYPSNEKIAAEQFGLLNIFGDKE
jgi:hypothetical protein